MINDERSLEKRLNNFRENKNAPTTSIEDIDKPLNTKTEVTNSLHQFNNSILEKIITIYTVIIFSVKTLVFGYALKTLFTMDWNFWQVICVGAFFNYMLIYIDDLIHSKNL